MLTNDLYLAGIKAAIHAGKAILEIYNSMDFGIEYKKDASPLTLADKSAHIAIENILLQTGVPILSEEGKTIDYSVRKNWSQLWIVDPLDGTKEFIKRNGDFTVNIALVENHRPIFGVVYVPVTGVMYFGEKGRGAFRYVQSDDFISVGYEDLIKTSTTLPVKDESRPYTVVASLSHMSPETQEFIDDLKKDHPNLVLFSRGSSLKLCAVAEGSADIYPRLGPTMEWDTAAGQAVVEAMGGTVLKMDNSPLTYNREELLNPYFVVRAQ